MKLALGTVQFGLDYGINNKAGKIDTENAFLILKEAAENGIDTLDTAFAYGDSEEIIGRYLKDKGGDFKIISKLPACEAAKVEYFVCKSLKRLNANRIYGYLFHDFGSYREDTNKLEMLEGLRREGIVGKVGFSLYYPDELEYLLKNKVRFDILQVPYNIFDQRFGGFFQELGKRNIEVHVRSVFLQGLFFKGIDELKGYFIKIKGKLIALRTISRETGIPLSALCQNFASGNEFIHKVIIGVDSPEQLKENLGAFSYNHKMEPVYTKLLDFRVDDEDIILPMNWREVR